MIFWIFDFLWNALGWYLIELVKRSWWLAAEGGYADPTNATNIRRHFETAWYTKPLGVAMALVLIYLVGLLVGNFLGRAFYRGLERLVLAIPVVRALYPIFKQITEFVLADREKQFAGSRVVAVRPHSRGIWSIALVTGGGMKPLDEIGDGETLTVFVPSSPTAFSGYVMVVPRSEVVELPMSVEEAMRYLVSGGVVRVDPESRKGKGKRKMAKAQDPEELPASEAAPPSLLPQPSDV
ncbi:MAG: DUF502 domain-containing protein [Planctomycetota bacterium]